MESHIGEPGKWSLEPRIVVFKRPFEDGAEATLKFTNLLNSRGNIRFCPRDIHGHTRSHLLRQFLDLEGPQGVTIFGFKDFTVDANATAQIVVAMDPPHFTPVKLKPMTRTQEVESPPPPSFAVYFRTDSDPLDSTPRLTLPIDYIDGPDPDTERISACNQCHRSSGLRYKCTECEESLYRLCSECILQYGREAHMARYGSSHQFELIPEASKCGICNEEVRDQLYSCIQCYDANSEKAMMCSQCYSDPQNLTEHFKGVFFGHNFKKFKISPPLRDDPEPSFHERNKPLACNGCKSRIRVEFFRCLDCVKAFNLCDRCADEGGLARHVSHNFQFSVPTNIAPKSGESSSANRLSNSEA